MERKEWRWRKVEKRVGERIKKYRYFCRAERVGIAQRLMEGSRALHSQERHIVACGRAMDAGRGHGVGVRVGDGRQLLTREEKEFKAKS
jgi:hypothetical protein